MLTSEILPMITWHDLAINDEHEAVIAWQGHLDAGCIGTRQPTHPAIAANRAASDALFRSFPSHRRGGRA